MTKEQLKRNTSRNNEKPLPVNTGAVDLLSGKHMPIPTFFLKAFRGIKSKMSLH